MFQGQRIKDHDGVRLENITGRIAGGPLRVARGLIKRAVRAHRRRLALRELEALDDRMLKDIGLSRGSLPYVIGDMFLEFEEREAASMQTKEALSAGLGAAAAEASAAGPLPRAA